MKYLNAMETRSLGDVKMEKGDSKEGSGEYGADWAILISILSERYR